MRLTIVAAVSAVFMSVFVATPAEAATWKGTCPKGKFCVYTGLTGTGTRAVFEVGDANLGDSTGPTGMNNKIKSVWNRSGEAYLVYDKKSCEGAWTAVYPAGVKGKSHKGNFTKPWRNRISSLIMIRYNDC